MRYPLLDGFRGFFLVMMTVHHLPIDIFVPLLLVDYTEFGLFGAAHGFVFLSGIVVALVYGRKLITGSPSQMRQALWHRIWVIYLYHAFLVIVVLLFSVAIVHWGSDDQTARINADAPWLNAFLSLTLLSGPKFIDILPMYLIFMAFTPAALIAIHAGNHLQVIAISVSIWLFAQIGIYGEFLNWVNDLTSLKVAGSYGVGMYFNRFAWQLIYVLGLLVGMLWIQGKLSLASLRSQSVAKVMPVLLALMFMFLVIKLLNGFPSVTDQFKITLTQNISHENVSLFRLANFAMMILLAVWLIEAGPSQNRKFVRRTAFLFRALMTWPPFVILGQHSLQVYSFHILLVYFVIYFVPTQDWPIAAQQVLSLSCAISLLLPAYAHKWWQDRQRSQSSA